MTIHIKHLSTVLSILLAISFMVFGGGVENTSAQLLGPIEIDNGSSPPGSAPPQSLSFWLSAGNDPVEPAPNSYTGDVYRGYKKTIKIWVNYPDNYGPPAQLNFTATSISTSSPADSSIPTGPLTTTTPLVGSIGNISIGNPLSNYISFDKDYCKALSQDGHACVGMIINAPAGYGVMGNHIITITAKRPVFRPTDIFHLSPYENATGVTSFVASVIDCPSGQNCSETDLVLSGNGLDASYYSDSNMSVLVGTQIDNKIDFSSECGPYNTPGPCSTASGARSYPFGFNGTDPNFSIRWEGYYYNAAAGSKSWSINHDDGMRIWIGDTQVLSDWGQATGPNPTSTSPIFLQANTYYPVKVEFQQVACCAARTIIGFEPNNLYVALPTDPNSPQIQRCLAVTAENLGQQGVNDLSCPPPSGILITDNTGLTYGSTVVDSSPSQNVSVPLEVVGIESSTIGLTPHPVVNLTANVYPDSSIIPNLGVINTPAGPLSTGITASAGVSASLSMPSCQTTCYPVLNIETPEDTIPGTYNIVVIASRTGQASVQSQSLEQGTYIYTLVVQPVQSIDPIIKQIEDAIASIIAQINDLIGGGVPGITTTPFQIYDSDFNYIIAGTGVFSKKIDVVEHGLFGLSAATLGKPPVRLNYVVSGDSPNNISASFAYPAPGPNPIPAPCGSSHCAGFISQNVPIFMSPGSTHNVSITMHNNSTGTWTSAGLYRLGSQNPQDNNTWGTHRVELPNSVAPGQSVTFNFNVTAPTTPGRYNFQWDMVQDGVAWFGDFTDNLIINVTDVSPYDACTYYQSSPIGVGESLCHAEAAINIPSNTPAGRYILKVIGDSHVTGSYNSSMYYVINVGSNPCPPNTTGPGVPNCTPDECPPGTVGTAGACVVPPSVFTHVLTDPNNTYAVNMASATTNTSGKIRVTAAANTIPAEGKTVSFTPTVTKLGALNTTGFTASASSCVVTAPTPNCTSTITITASSVAAGQYIVSFASSANDGSAPGTISYTVTVTAPSGYSVTPTQTSFDFTYGSPDVRTTGFAVAGNPGAVTFLQPLITDENGSIVTPAASGINATVSPNVCAPTLTCPSLLVVSYTPVSPTLAPPSNKTFYIWGDTHAVNTPAAQKWTERVRVTVTVR